MDDEIIYLDNNATTRPLEEVVQEFAQLSLGNGYYNINTNSSVARKKRDDIELCSKDILEVAGLDPREYGVAYAASSTEINKGIISLFGPENVVTTPYEHKSILSCLTPGNPGDTTQGAARSTTQRTTRSTIQGIAKSTTQSTTQGIAQSTIQGTTQGVSRCPLTLSLDQENGIVTPKELERVLRTVTLERPKGSRLLVSIMAANNEFPSRNDLQALYKVVRSFTGVVFHTDATQLFGKIAPGGWHADLINFSTHKFHGLKGVGVLLYRKSLFPEGVPLVGGTPNSPAILAHAPLWKKLLGVPHGTSDDNYLDLRIRLLNALHPLGVVSFEPRDARFLNPGTCLLSFPGKCNLLMKKHLDKEGVVVSIGSACDTKKSGASDTIKAMGLLGNDGIIRVSFGTFTTTEDIDVFVEVMRRVLPKSEKILLTNVVEKH